MNFLLRKDRPGMAKIDLEIIEKGTVYGILEKTSIRTLIRDFLSL